MGVMPAIIVAMVYAVVVALLSGPSDTATLALARDRRSLIAYRDLFSAPREGLRFFFVFTMTRRAFVSFHDRGALTRP